MVIVFTLGIESLLTPYSYSSSSRRIAPEGVPKYNGHSEKNGHHRNKQQYTPRRDAFSGSGVLGAQNKDQGGKGTRGDEDTVGADGNGDADSQDGDDDG